MGSLFSGFICPERSRPHGEAFESVLSVLLIANVAFMAFEMRLESSSRTRSSSVRFRYRVSDDAVEAVPEAFQFKSVMNSYRMNSSYFVCSFFWGLLVVSRSWGWCSRGGGGGGGGRRGATGGGVAAGKTTILPYMRTSTSGLTYTLVSVPTTIHGVCMLGAAR